MSLSIISATSKQEEIEIQAQINYRIDKFESIVFSAGAGSGKTYALIESLKYILQTHGSKLQYHNQKIICITYTNVAANKIKEGLGNSELIKVSTIHERLWDFIKGYKEELLRIHVEKINQQLVQLKFDLTENQDDEIKKTFKAFRTLSDDLKNSFKELIISQKELFYKNYDKPAKSIRSAFDAFLKPYPNILKNVGSFRKIVTTIYKIKNYELCLKNIRNRKDNYTTIKYNSKYNSDMLHRMIISHDTLLDYALKIVSDYDLLKQIIFDTYPYILIDESQDTNEKVVTIMKLIAEYAKRIQHKIFIGYFGDPSHTIYDAGVGKRINEIHPDLQIITNTVKPSTH